MTEGSKTAATGMRSINVGHECLMFPVGQFYHPSVICHEGGDAPCRRIGETIRFIRTSVPGGRPRALARSGKEILEMDTLLNLLLVGGLIFVMMRFGCGAHAGQHSGHGTSTHEGGCCGGHGHDRNPTPKEKREGTAP